MSGSHTAVPGISRSAIGILAFSQIANDPRVRRQGELFSKAGWDVAAFGLPDASVNQPAWIHHVATGDPPDGGTGDPDWEIPVPFAARISGLARLERSAAIFRRGLSLQRRIMTRIRLLQDDSYAIQQYWSEDEIRSSVFRAAVQHRPDIWIANDWTTLPIAARLATEQGVPFVYDTHELATEEYAEKIRWRLLHRPFIMSVERTFLLRADLITCVSDGIARRLQELYKLRERPVVIRNVPHYQRTPFRPTGEQVRVLYHGVVAPGRGLEDCIRSVSSWRPEFDLTIRGPVSSSYRASLQALIQAHQLNGRVRLAPPVPMIDLAKEASEFDIGLFALPGHSRHNRLALPNKFFEYVMAGLALCVSDLPEMECLLKEQDLGVLIPGMQPSQIAAAVNRLDRGSIDRFKRNALQAACELNWEHEGANLLRHLEVLVRFRREGPM